MKRTILSVWILIGLSVQGFAQDLEYIEVSNDPGKAVSQLYVGLEPIFVDINGINGIAMGFGGYAHYHIKQDLMFQARFQTPYWKGIIDGARLGIGNKAPEGGYFNDYDPAKLSYLDVNASFKLMRIDRPNRPVKIWLSTGGTDLNNYIDGAFATKRYQVMARGGLFMRNTTVPLNDLPEAAAGWNNSGDAYTNLNSMSIYAGASINKMWELVANITELDIGKKIARMHKSYYIDLMYAPVMNVRDLEKGGQTVVIKGEDLDANQLDVNRLGVRLGIANMPEYKNMLSGWEIGTFPSVISKDNKWSGAFWRWWLIVSLYSSDKT